MQWTPTERGYLKGCPICYEAFYGRKNKVYCGAVCKARQNNDLAADRKVEGLQVTGSLLRNQAILKSVLEEEGFGLETKRVEELEARGFDSTAPNSRVVLDGEKWFKCGNYLYMIYDGTVEIKDISNQ